VASRRRAAAGGGESGSCARVLWEEVVGDTQAPAPTGARPLTVRRKRLAITSASPSTISLPVAGKGVARPGPALVLADGRDGPGKRPGVLAADGLGRRPAGAASAAPGWDRASDV